MGVDGKMIWVCLCVWWGVGVVVIFRNALKKFIFSNVYVSINTIFECLYMFFWLRKGPSIKYLRKWWWDGWSLKIRAAAYNSFHVFGSIFVLSYL